MRDKIVSALVWILIGILVLGLLAITTRGDDNLLANPSFEQGTELYHDEWGNTIAEIELPRGWSRFVYEPQCGPGCNYRPECKPELAILYGYARIRHGDAGTKCFTTYATHRYWLGQTVTVTAGSVVEAIAWSMAWSSTKDDPKVSAGGSYRTRIGIDPTGGDDPHSESVVWSEPEPGRKAMDGWEQHEATAISQGAVTLWLEGWPEWPVKHNDSYWDDARLTVLSAPTATPGPTLAPTATPEPTPTPDSLEDFVRDMRETAWQRWGVDLEVFVRIDY